MYNLVSASVKLKDSSTGWKAKDIANIPLKELFSLYSGIYVILSNPYLNSEVAFNVYNLNNQHANSDITFQQFLYANGDNVLATEPKENAVFQKKIVKYIDLFRAGYRVRNTAPNTPPDTIHAEKDKTWLVLNKDGVSNETIFKYCIGVVNGFCHQMDYDQHAAYIVDGMKSNFISGNNLAGLMSFAELGQIECLPITAEMLYKQTPSQEYKNTVCLNIGKSLVGKTLILVLGGYMHVLDDTMFKMIDDERCIVHFNNYPFIDRYYESKKYIDLSSLNLEETLNNPDQRGVNDFFADDTITAYFTLSQSFLIIVDAADLSITKKYLRKPLLPEQYISDIKPNMPLVVGTGKLGNYWYAKHHGQWSVTCVDTVRNNLVFGTTKMNAQTSFTNQRIPNKPQRRSNAYFLEIAKEV